MKRILSFLFPYTIRSIALEGQAIGYSNAVSDLKELLKEKDKVHIEPMIITGDNQTISNLGFYGCDTALYINTREPINVE